MDDFRILQNLFEKNDDEIHFNLFKESNIIAHNNNNQGNFNKEINFNTQSLASQIINYKDAYILLEIQVAVPYQREDQGKKTIPYLLYLKKSYEIVDSLKIFLNNVIISNEVNINRSSLVNYILNNGKNNYTDHRNIELNTSNAEDLTIKYNPFISKETYVRSSDIGENDDISDKFHYVNFKIPIFLKDISDFFKKVDLIKFGEFSIDISFIDKIIISKSCTTQLVSFSHDISVGLNSNNLIDVIYLDFAKAFDTVNHDIILLKLKNEYNIDGLMLKFIKEYLQERKQRVAVNGTLSDIRAVKSGVPQGSILGPLLFILFINSMQNRVSPGTQIALYADDTKLWRRIVTPNDHEILQRDINALFQWSIENKMCFSC